MTDKTVSHAIERGIDFLFANRLFCGNEPRLWEDFDLLPGPSDEWVTAYAACALLSLFFVIKWVKETKGKELEDMDDFIPAGH
jgi:hypothetical protein